MDLSVTYLGLRLPHPFMPGASPLVDDLAMVDQLAEAGASAIVMHSLFEEQLTYDQVRAFRDSELYAESFAEATSVLPELPQYRLGPEAYLEQIRAIKERVGLPVIASLNGATPSGWLEYAKLMQQAGADALELNYYYLPIDSRETPESVEQRLLDVVKIIREEVTIPIAVKLSPFYTCLPNLATKLELAGAEGLVLFNRFYQPDLDVENLEVTTTLQLSDSSELLLRLRWLAILYGRFGKSLACSGGVHTGLDALKAIMCGASAVQMVSALLHHGPQRLAQVREEVARWLEEHEYESLQQALGSMSLRRCPDPAGFERTNYMRILQSFRLSP
ncbi:MAG: dihydroorotate dehydrogenase-like protein [Thermoanaerobaculum sp.]|nr:dihydroorotate dehydrogenase-like protein [Thermoanaerobaculum sp.]